MVRLKLLLLWRNILICFILHLRTLFTTLIYFLNSFNLNKPHCDYIKQLDSKHFFDSTRIYAI